MLDTLYWDLPRLFAEMKIALGKGALDRGELEGIGVDTWGVDFGLIGRGDTLLGNPVHYRDHEQMGCSMLLLNDATRNAFMRLPAYNSCRSIRFTSFWP